MVFKVLEQLKNFGLINVQPAKSTYGNHYIQYLDYTLVKPGIVFGANPQTGIDKESLVNDGFIVPHLEDPEELTSGEESIFHSSVERLLNSSTHVSLVLNKVIVEFKAEDVKIEPGEDPISVVTEHLLKLTVAKIRELALINKNEIELVENIKLDYQEEAGDDIKRRLITRLLMASNLIATRSRRGHGTYVIAKRDTINLISQSEPTSYVYQLEVFPTISNLKLFVCNDLGDEIIVGRCGSTDEPGIQFISNEDSLEKNIFFNETDIAGINIRYALESFSPNDKHNYVSFNFNRYVFQTI
jgi:hypothetical protein